MTPNSAAADLKKIPVAQLRRGMYLHRLEGSWLQHPFWRRSFVLESAEDLRTLHTSGVEEAWIDLSRGLGPADDAPDGAVPPEPAGLEPACADAPASVRAAVVQVALREELDRARTICDSARGAVVSMFNDARMGRVVEASAAMPLVADIADSVARNPAALISMARLKTQDDYTYMHSVAVCALMVALGRQLGQSEEEVREAGLGGLMHDLGKALMPVEILTKPGTLTEDEFRIMKMHPTEGWRLLEEGGTASELVRTVALHHHEKYDGSGYPGRQAGDAIALHARMGAICDVYDAVTSDRPYKLRWDPGYAVRQMAAWKGHFDPRLFQAFIKSLGIYPVGSLVRLASDRLAVVAEQNNVSLLHPVVRVFYSVRLGLRIPPQRIDLHAPGADDRITAVEDPAAWNFKDLDALWMS